MVKPGYSLVEALVVMIVMSILFAMTSNVITTKRKPQTKNEAHGYFECYKNNPGDYKVIQRLVYENKEIENITKANNICNFIPPKGTQSFAVWTNLPYQNGETVIIPSIKDNTVNISVSNGSPYNNQRFTFGDDILPVIQYNTLTNDEKNNHYSVMRFIYKNTKIFEVNNIKWGVLIGW